MSEVHLVCSTDFYFFGDLFWLSYMAVLCIVVHYMLNELLGIDFACSIRILNYYDLATLNYHLC